MYGLDSPDFNIETYLANEEKRQEIAQLHQLASDCNDELQYATAERFYQRAADLAEQLNDLSLMIKERFWLATVQRMQGKNKEALGVFTWLIEVAYSPDLSRDLGEDDLWYVEGGFRNFVEVGLYLPEMPTAELERVIDRGLDWLSSIGNRHWAAGLRWQRGSLWQAQGRKAAALEEMEAALALRRRNPTAPGYTLGAHLLGVADLLQNLEQLDAATTYYQEVAEGYEFDGAEQRWAWEGLAQVAIQRQEWAEAERCALKSLDLARGIESPNPIMLSYDVLGDVYWKQERIPAAIDAKLQSLRYARQYKEENDLHELYRDFAEIRLHQARQSQPQRFIPKAQQWLRWAMPLAMRLDRQVNSTERQTKIRQLQAECEDVLATNE
jgi:tetratricopeptide (TPR) repeat protein